MADTFVPTTFVPDELLTSTKMNQLSANQAAFHDGNGFSDGAIVARHYQAGSIDNSKLANAAICLGDVIATAGEITYTAGVWTDVPSMSVSVTTTKANQKVCVLSQLQTYTGGASRFRYVVNGTAVSNIGQYMTGLNSTTTGLVVYIDSFTIATAGTHTVKLQVCAGASSLRIIHGEGQGKVIVLSQ